MKVLFSNPPWWDREEGRAPQRYWRAGVRAGSRWPFTSPVRSAPDRFRFGDYLPYPHFMGYATSYVAGKTGADVQFRDSIALRESYDEYYHHVGHAGYDFIFIETATPSWDNDRAVIGEIHRLSPRSKIVICGPIASTKSEEILRDFPVYACIRGEYEKGSVRVINGESGIIDYDLLTLEEMNAAPFPYYHPTYAKRYWDSLPYGQLRPHAHVLSSRGCPYKCIFCVWPATMTSNDPDGTGRRIVRHYSPEYMEAFLSEIVGRYGYKSIYFDDDTFNLGNSHVLDMCGVMRRIGLPWSAMCRADGIRMDTWRAMKESGCFGVKLGFESGNQWVIDHIVNKRLDLERGRELVHELKRLGMTVHGTFTFGLPGETREQMLDTQRFMDSLPFDSIQTSGCATIEGTPLHTLLGGGALAAYDGAHADADYVSGSDGAKNWDVVSGKLSQDEEDGQAPCAPDAFGRINAVCKGYSLPLHWSFFRMLLSEHAFKDICVLGVYFGRDVAYMAAIQQELGRVHWHITGVDKFEDACCEDWPEEARNLSWEEAGFGEAPAIEKAQANLTLLGLDRHVTLHKARAEEFLRTADGEFDLIYIDTSHDYETTLTTIRLAVPLLRDGGIIAGDDLSDEGTWGVKRAVQESFAACQVAGGWIWFANKADFRDDQILPVQRTSRV